jgi:polyisoprenyl-teichoic acid--peptidoglycan teichoic acid transferase
MNGISKAGKFVRRRACFPFVLALGLILLAGLILPPLLRTSDSGEVVDGPPMLAVDAPAALAAESPALANSSPTPGRIAGAGDMVENFTTPRPLRPFEPAGDKVPVYYPTPQAWDGKQRVNILILGLDYGDWNNPDRDGPARTDTMLVFSIDTNSHEAGILSIPRDLTVDIPGMIRPNKINTAHRFGEYYNLPGGGPGLSMKTVEQLLGVPIDYYARIDFYAFEKLIDEIGGVELDVPEEITVDPLGPQNTVTLLAGRQHLDGATALAYARARNTPNGDFDRAIRQHQVILAVQERVMKIQMLPLLIFKAPRLYKQISEGIQTNLPLEKAIRLAWLSRRIEADDIQTGAIGRGQLYVEMTEENVALFRASPERVRLEIERVFGLSADEFGQLPDLQERMQAEEPRVFILDGTGVEGLGKRTADYLEAQGFLVEDVFLAEEPPGRTGLIDYTRKPYAVQYLTRLMAIYHSDIKVKPDPGSPVDVMIMLGKDWARNKTVP